MHNAIVELLHRKLYAFLIRTRALGCKRRPLYLFIPACLYLLHALSDFTILYTATKSSLNPVHTNYFLVTILLFHKLSSTNPFGQMFTYKFELFYFIAF